MNEKDDCKAAQNAAYVQSHLFLSACITRIIRSTYSATPRLSGPDRPFSRVNLPSTMHTPVTRRLRLATKATLQLLVSSLLRRMSTRVTRSLSTAFKVTFSLHTLASLSLIPT